MPVFFHSHRPPGSSLLLATVCAACGDAAPGGSTDDGPLSTSTAEDPPSSPTAGSTPGDMDPDDPSTGTAADTSGTTTGDTGPVEEGPVCGDGKLDPDEQCDQGEALNGPNAYCTDACKVNLCGDGQVLAGTEDCDDGAANSDAHGSLCNSACERGTWCGDNLVQAEHEQCDNGPDNGTGAVNREGLACDRMCRVKARRIFITSNAFDGDLGGLTGADEKCRQAAKDAVLPEPERFIALLSDAGTSMKTRYEDLLVEPLPYVLLTGTKIADSYPALFENGPGELGIHLDEKREIVQNKLVATGLAPDGSIYQEFDAQDMLLETDCEGWTSDGKSAVGRVGLNTMPADEAEPGLWQETKRWVSYDDISCNKAFRLYCIEL